MKRIVYIGFYDLENDVTRKRNAPPSALTKMGYIIRALNSLGYGVDLVSAARPEDGKADGGCLLRFGENTLKLFSSVRTDNPLGKVLSYIQRKWSLYRYLRRHLTKDDVVLVYHSVFYASMLTRLKKRIGFRMLGEVEEIYADVTGKNSGEEEAAFFSAADGYLFPTHLLNDRINGENKPYCVIHGTYQEEKNRGESFDDGRIHVVYAGILDPRKGGDIAAAAAEYLDERYSVHILGYGQPHEVEAVKKTVADVSSRTACKVAFEGLKQGEEYISFIQRCQIGLCPQDPDAAFTATSFPSKILSYLSNGLRVLSIRIPAIEQSAVGQCLYFYDRQTPREVANALMRIDMTAEYDSRGIIRTLDRQFVSQISRLLDE